MKIQKRIVAVCGALAVCLTATAWAGFKANGQVVIYPSTRIVDGVPGSARNSADSVQYIGCKVYQPALGGTLEALCVARDAGGAVATCYTNDPGQVKVIRSIDDNSAIRFIYNASGGCTFVSVEKISYYEPKLR